MPQLRAVIVIFAVIVFSALLGAEPATQPVYIDPFAFIENYRVTHYLESATEIQKLDVGKRAARLKEIAADPQHASEVFPLCRMLFEAKAKAEFRRPLIGGPVFVDGGDIADWTKEPITLRHDIPILVATGYNLGGKPEEPGSYLEYCLAKCQWRKVKYSVVDKSQIRKTIDEFIASNSKLADHAEWLRRQAE